MQSIQIQYKRSSNLSNLSKTHVVAIDNAECGFEVLFKLCSLIKMPEEKIKNIFVCNHSGGTLPLIASFFWQISSKMDLVRVIQNKNKNTACILCVYYIICSVFEPFGYQQHQLITVSLPLLAVNIKKRFYKPMSIHFTIKQENLISNICTKLFLHLKLSFLEENA